LARCDCGVCCAWTVRAGSGVEHACKQSKQSSKKAFRNNRITSQLKYLS
jgi:hypothetical protein